jgi:thiamine-phosphate pyrophosphorylase
MTAERLRGLYAITDPRLCRGPGLLEAVAAAIAGGARVIQYRDKGTDGERRLAEASELALLCRRHGVPLIVNDDVELAAAAGADGVHLGRDDPRIAAARARLGAGALIGVSCYDRLDLALEAQAAGADYVAFGRFFPSNSKPLAVPADLPLLRAARPMIHLPIAAIGGITPDNGGPLVTAGADLLAVIQGVFGAGDVTAACRRFAPLFVA